MLTDRRFDFGGGSAAACDPFLLLSISALRSAIWRIMPVDLRSSVANFGQASGVMIIGAIIRAINCIEADRKSRVLTRLAVRPLIFRSRRPARSVPADDPPTIDEDMFSFTRIFLACAAGVLLFSAGVSAQQAGPVIVQPGAPGKPTRVLPPATRGKLPPIAQKDIEFMQGMIHHHAQAVEMTALIAERSSNAEIALLGERITKSQTDEMEFMKRWLSARGEPAEAKSAKVSHDHSGHAGHGAAQPLMPGMLSEKQMADLRAAKAGEFDRLFLAGMIQHHEGALVMVADLFDTAGTGQDGELFNFATDVDTSQRAEIDIMRNMLEKLNVKEKP